MVHTLGGLGQPEITRGSLIPTPWVSHRSFVGMGGESLEREGFTSTGGARVHAGGAVGGGVGSGERPQSGGGSWAHPGRPHAALGRGGSPLLRVPARKNKGM